MTRIFGGVEAGGTKCVCAVGSGPETLEPVERIATTTPEETLRRIIRYFAEHPRRREIRALGVGSFGPLDLNRSSPTYGHITSTPKAGWLNTNVAGTLEEALGIPVGFDTDVNAAALGEHRWGAARGLHTFLYMTIGTGIGGGAMAEGRLLHGLLHTEMGHVLLPHDRTADPFGGICPFHRDCFEGLASGPALQARWGGAPEQFAPDHPAWPLEARYIALALVNTICTLSPQRIILGGGVMDNAVLFPLIRHGIQFLLGGYIQSPHMREGIDSYIVPPALGSRAGILGAIALAQGAGRGA